MIININIPDDQDNRVVQSFAKTFGYEDEILDPNNPNGPVTIPNPQTKRQFFKAKLIEYIKSIVCSYETEQARRNISITNIDIN